MSLGDPFLNVGNFSNILAMKATTSKLGRQSTVRLNTNMDNNILLAKNTFFKTHWLIFGKYAIKHVGSFSQHPVWRI